MLAVDLAGLLAVGDLGAKARRREERLDASTAGAQSLGQCSLRAELDLELARQELLLEDLVLADVARDHPLDLVLSEQDAEAFLGRAAVVRHDREVADVAPRELADAVLGVAGQPEAAGEDHCPVEHVVERRLGVRVDLVHCMCLTADRDADHHVDDRFRLT